MNARAATATREGRDSTGAGGSRIGRFLEVNGTLVVVLAVFALLLLVDARNELVTDGWMALLSGREVVRHGLPGHEHLTIWASGRRWVDQQWLAQVAIYGVERLGGLRLLMIVHALVSSAALAAAAVLARRLGASARAATWVTVPVLVVYFPGAAVMRTQTLTLILFVALLALLVGDEIRPSRRVFWSLAILVLWANMHGSVVLAAALVSAYGLLQAARALRRRPRTFEARTAVLAVVPWACVFASPYALHLPAYYREVLFSGGFADYVTEWAPTTLKLTTAPLYLLVGLGLWLLGRYRGRVTTFEKLVFAGTALLAFEATRNMVWFALVALVVLPRLADGLRAAPDERLGLNRLLATATLFGVLVATAGVAAKGGSWFVTNYPTAAADAAAAAAGADGRIFANERYADWLLWTHPELAGRVAFDSRFELLKPAQLRAVANFRNRAADWHRTIRGYRVLVLDPVDERKVARALVREGSAAVVRGGEHVAVLRTTRP